MSPTQLSHTISAPSAISCTLATAETLPEPTRSILRYQAWHRTVPPEPYLTTAAITLANVLLRRSRVSRLFARMTLS